MCQKILRLSLTTRRPRYSTVSHGTAQLLHGQKNTCLPLSTIGAREGHYICRVLFTVVGLTHVHKELPISHQPDTLVGSAYVSARKPLSSANLAFVGEHKDWSCFPKRARGHPPIGAYSPLHIYSSKFKTCMANWSGVANSTRCPASETPMKVLLGSTRDVR